MQACTHFLACTTEAYLQAVEQNSGRPFRELKAAVAALSSQRMLCLCLEAAGPVPHQRVQQIAPLELRKAFVNKSHVRPPRRRFAPRRQPACTVTAHARSP